jgi:hypothetical protein
VRNENSDDDSDMLDDEADKDMDNNAVDGPTVLAHVELCRTVCKYFYYRLGPHLLLVDGR